MAELSRPWSGIVTGDSGPYSDDQWTDVWSHLISPAVATDGVFWDQLAELNLIDLPATPITLESGRALVDGTWYQSTSTISIAIGSPAVNPRIDRLVLRKDWVLQTVRLTVITGAEGASPVPPALVQVDGTTWDLPLWQIRITVGGVITFFADDREFIGQYAPIGVTSTRVYWHDDFYMGGASLANGEKLNHWEAVIATGDNIFPLNLAGFGAGGLAYSHDGAGNNDNATLISRFYKPDVIDARLIVRLKSPNTDANEDLVVGFVSASPGLTPNDGVYFRSNGGANWFAVCRTGAAETAVDTAQAQDDTFREFQIRQTGTDVVQFLIDDVVVATIQATIPNDVALFAVISAFGDGVGAPVAQEYLHVDWARLEGTR